MVANVAGVRVAIVGKNEVAIVVMVEKSEYNLELMAITNKEDIVELYVLVLYNFDIYPNKDDEEGDHLEGWPRGHGARKRVKWMATMMAKGDLIGCFQN